MFDFFESQLELIFAKLLVEREDLVGQQLLQMKKNVNQNWRHKKSTTKWYKNNKNMLNL